MFPYLNLLHAAVVVLADLCPDFRLRVVLVILREALALWCTC